MGTKILSPIEREMKSLGSDNRPLWLAANYGASRSDTIEVSRILETMDAVAMTATDVSERRIPYHEWADGTDGSSHIPRMDTELEVGLLLGLIYVEDRKKREGK